MSVEEVERTVQLDIKDIFNHRYFLIKEIERFRDGFERNDRFKEFESLIKKNHMMYEALETPVEQYLKTKPLQTLADKLNKMNERLRKMSKPHFSPCEFDSLNLLQISQAEIHKLAEVEAKKMKTSCEKIIEME